MKKLAILLAAAAFVFSFFVTGEKTNAQNGEIKPEITVRFDKDFGYFVGDIVAVQYEIKMPNKGWRISLKDLPQANQTIGQGMEIREIKTRQSRESSRAVVTLEIKFQIFRVFDRPKSLSIPAIAFFYGPEKNPRQLKGSLPQVPVKISPLCGRDEPMLQPFFEPAVRSSQKALAAVFAGSILMIAGWLWFFKIFINQRRHPSPFKEALRKIKRIKPEDYRGALLVFRHALNQKTGRAIFIHNLDELFRIVPQAKKRWPEISKIIEVCDNLHFNPNFQPDSKALFGLKSRLISELKHLTRSERWT